MIENTKYMYEQTDMEVDNDTWVNQQQCSLLLRTCSENIMCQFACNF